jgi:hypothetical protein
MHRAIVTERKRLTKGTQIMKTWNNGDQEAAEEDEDDDLYS